MLIADNGIAIFFLSLPDCCCFDFSLSLVTLSNLLTQVQVVAELAKQYGFTDIGGDTPPSIRSLRFLLPTYLFPKILPEGTKVDSSSVPDWLLPMFIMANGKPPS